MLKVYIILYFIVITVKSENGRNRRGEGRQGRLFSFAIEEEDIVVDLDFSIPFLKIPVKKTMNSAGLMDFPTININPASLALGGAVVLGTSIVVPFLLKSYVHDDKYRYAKILDNAEFGTDAVLDFAQQMLSDNNGFRGCPLRIACWAAQQEYTNPRKIFNQIVNNKLLSMMVNSSAVEDAMISGRHGRTCTSYEPCPLEEQHVLMLMSNLAVLTNVPGFQ